MRSKKSDRRFADACTMHADAHRVALSHAQGAVTLRELATRPHLDEATRALFLEGADRFAANAASYLAPSVCA